MVDFFANIGMYSRLKKESLIKKSAFPLEEDTLTKYFTKNYSLIATSFSE